MHEAFLINALFYAKPNYEVMLFWIEPVKTREAHEIGIQAARDHTFKR